MFAHVVNCLEPNIARAGDMIMLITLIDGLRPVGPLGPAGLLLFLRRSLLPLLISVASHTEIEGPFV